MKIHKQILLLLLIFILKINSTSAQFWTEDFISVNTIPDGLANGYTGANGVWIVSSLVGDSGLYANKFYISCQEAGMQINNCGDICQPVQPPPSPYIGQSLHISSSVLGDNGGLYIETGTGNQCNTEIRAESPTINCMGYTDLALTFNYIENGESTNDNADLWYFDGTNWSFLYDMNKTSCGDGAGGPCNQVPCDGTNQGYWTNSPVIALPSTANNNPNVKIGIRWINNDDGISTDPSIAITNIQLTSNVNVGIGSKITDEPVSIYPNPSQNNTTLEINTAFNETVLVMLYNNLGQLISEEKINLTAGNNKKELTTQKLMHGLYTIKIIGNGVHGVKQLIKE